MFRKEVVEEAKPKKIAWDLNLFSMDGFYDKSWIRVNLKTSLHIAHNLRKLEKKIQKLSKNKPKTAKRLMQKYSKRYRDEVKDFLHKLTKKLANEFKDYEHGFEDLENQGMLTKFKTHNRVVSKQNWKQIMALLFKH